MVVAIGIDLGTTNCCVAVYRNGNLEVLTNKEGHRTTPSIIGFKNNEILVGNVAKNDSYRNVENTIYNVKRLIGLKYTDEQVMKLRADLRFSVVNINNKLNISIKKENENTVHYLPEQLSGILLQQLRDDAEKRLDCTITDAVITVPSYFNDSQRQGTVDAGKIAGFKNVRLLNEPTAAALYYGMDNRIDERTILVFDFGGGTFDVSIINYSNNLYEILLIDGEFYLGGEDIDNKLIQYILKNYNMKVTSNRNMARLKYKVEAAKIDLSSKLDTEIDLPDWTEEDINITRIKFDETIEDIIEKTMKIVEKSINDKKLKNIKIDDILLVGGSTRIPIIEKKLKKFGLNIKHNTNADEAVASGAAIYAAKIFNNEFPQLKTINICQHNLGVEIDGGKMSTLIPKFSKLPASQTKRYKTANNDQDIIDVVIFCGDDLYVKNNLYLGKFRVSGIKSGPNGTFLRETFEVDDNGILNVTAIDEAGQSQQMQFNLDNGNLTKNEIDHFCEQLIKERILSNKIADFKEAKNNLQCHTNDSATLEWLSTLEYSPKKFDLLKEKLPKL